MNLHIGTDHAGFEVKELLISYLKQKGYNVIDHGALTYDKNDNYPKYCIDAARAVIKDKGSFGIVLGGSGNGEQIAANKVLGVRAALVWNESTAKLARLHNNANIISIGAREHTIDQIKSFVDIFLNTQYDEKNSQRHQKRIDEISEYEISKSI